MWQCVANHRDEHMHMHMHIPRHLDADVQFEQTYGRRGARGSQHRRDAVLDGEALARLGADEVALDDLDLEEHVVQRLPRR